MNTRAGTLLSIAGGGSKVGKTCPRSSAIDTATLAADADATPS